MRCRAKGIEVVIYEPTMKEETLYKSRVILSLDEFKKILGVIVAN